jgi:hypothetical protein
MRLSDFAKEPIIIGGCGRSGTTVLLAILGSHPGIFAIREETRIFCPTGYSVLANLEAPIEIQRVEAYLKNDTIVPSCQRWCEKTPKNVVFFGPILRAFGERVKIIHIVRDGRDVITSIHPRRPDCFHISISRWLHDTTSGLRFSNHPNVLTIRYEDLVLHFEPTMRHICDFLDERFVSDLLHWHARTNIKWSPTWKGGSVLPLYDTSIGRWKCSTYRKRVQEFESNPRALACLDQLGYY